MQYFIMYVIVLSSGVCLVSLYTFFWTVRLRYEQFRRALVRLMLAVYRSILSRLIRTPTKTVFQCSRWIPENVTDHKPLRNHLKSQKYETNRKSYPWLIRNCDRERLQLRWNPGDLSGNVWNGPEMLTKCKSNFKSISDGKLSKAKCKPRTVDSNDRFA